MVDSEDLIRSVEKFRAIWDLEDEGYHNKGLKDEAWNGVCLDLIADWDFLPEGDKYIQQLEMKKKWNNIRDYYKKLLSEQRPGEQEVRAKKRRYLYSDILEFIRPVYDKKRYELESNDSAQSDTQEDVERSSIGFPAAKTAQKRPKNARINPVSQLKRVTRPALKNKKRTSQMTAFERSVINSLEKSTMQDVDPDLSFLKSLLPDMQKLTLSQKFDFKLGIMELYKNISNGGVQVDNDFDHLSQAQDIKVETIRLSDDDETYVSS